MERHPVLVLPVVFLMNCHVVTSSASGHRTLARRAHASRSTSSFAPSALSHRLSTFVVVPTAKMARWCDLSPAPLYRVVLLCGANRLGTWGPTWTRPRNVGPGSTWRSVKADVSWPRRQSRTARERCNHGSIGKEGTAEWRCPAPAPQWVP